MRSNKLMAAVGLLGGVFLTAAPAMAQSNYGPSVGTITIDATSAAAGVGYTWGDGVLTYHGHRYPFAVNGISVADVGYAHVHGYGHVYGLKDVQDFAGTYGAAEGQATLDKGIGGQYLRNANGVSIKLDDVSRGARLAAAADGVKLALK